MPIFTELEILFVHIPKNAGRSIEQALLGDSGTPDDGRRSFVNRIFHGLSIATASKVPQERLFGTLDVVTVAQHLTYLEMDLLGVLTDRQKSALTSFAVCRNPYDRAVSSVNHVLSGKIRGRTKIQNSNHFEGCLREWLDGDLEDHNLRAHRRQQIDYILDKRGKTAIDNVLRYEYISREFSELMSKVGAPQINLPWRGKSSRDRGYEDYYNGISKKLVEQAYGEDIEYFKYTF